MFNRVVKNVLLLGRMLFGWFGGKKMLLGVKLVAISHDTKRENVKHTSAAALALLLFNTLSHLFLDLLHRSHSKKYFKDSEPPS